MNRLIAHSKKWWDMDPALLQEAIEGYKRAPTQQNLFEVHDALMLMAAQGGGGKVVLEPLNEVRKIFQKTTRFKSLYQEVKNHDYSNLTIGYDDALHLSRLSAGNVQKSWKKTVKARKLETNNLRAVSDNPEFSGCFRFSGDHIELVSSSRLMAPGRAFPSLKGLVESNSHGWWHTHPYKPSFDGPWHYPHQPSLGDQESTKKWKVPFVMGMMTDNKRPTIWIVDPKGRSHQVRVLRKTERPV